MIDVVAAILIDNEDKVLIARRKEGKNLSGYWEFPGGKIEVGEEPICALVRELKEEMNINIKVERYFETSIYDYGNTSVNLIAYFARIDHGTISLIDHDRAEWVSKDHLIDYNFAPADIPFIKKLNL